MPDACHLSDPQELCGAVRQTRRVGADLSQFGAVRGRGQDERRAGDFCHSEAVRAGRPAASAKDMKTYRAV